MCGGIGGFAPGIDLMYCTYARDSRMHADLIALLLRSTSASWPPGRRPPPLALELPAGATSGGGGSLGAHFVSFYRPGNQLFVDGVHLMHMIGVNVVLFVERDGALIVSGTEKVSSDVGPVSGWHSGGLTQRFKKVLAESPRVQAFMQWA